MATTRKSAGFAHILLLIVLVVVIAIVTLTAVKVIQNKKAVQTERELYVKLDKEARAYIQAINAKYPGKVTHTQSCRYTSAEWSPGWLGCSVGGSIEYPEGSPDVYEQTLSYANTQLNYLPWGSSEDNTDALRKEGDSIIANRVYMQNKAISCSVSYYRTANLLIDIDCSGSALTEYYPVDNK